MGLGDEAADALRIRPAPALPGDTAASWTIDVQSCRAPQWAEEGWVITELAVFNLLEKN